MAVDPRQLVVHPERPPDAGPAARGQSVVFPLADVERSIGERFAAQVRDRAGHVALRTSSVTLSYGELAAAATGIAARLIARLGAGELPVLLLVRDDARYVAAFLAAVQAGKICIPVDPDHPLPWLATIWRDTGARVIVTEAACLDLARRITGDPQQILVVDESTHDSGGAFAAPEIGPDRLACILYTSGSSGAPKGVVYSHRAVLHGALKPANGWPYAVTDRISLLAARGTAAEMVGIFGTLLIGAELHPFHLRESGLSELRSWLLDLEITVWRLSPSLLRSVLESLPAGEVFPAMRLVRLGSEPATLRDLELFRRHFLPGCVLANAYATSETALISMSFFDHGTTPAAGHLLPVGYPMQDTEVLVVGPTGQPVPAGETGEIVVRSEYLATGYWRRPDLTAAAFLPDPDGGRRRLYRTGDLGRMSPDGCLAHLGRRDQQVKVHGYRVELAELEAALLQAPAVHAAAAAAHDDGRGGNRLVGYVVPAAGGRPSAAGLRAFLQERLPDYMIPGAYVVLDRLPTTAAGKLDRGALPPPAADLQDLPPQERQRTHLETQLADIWAELLKRPRVGLQEDFFDLGGDSLLAMEMLLRIEQDCGARVDRGRVLSGMTIERLAAELLTSSHETLAKPVVLIQSGASRAPFFFLHGDVYSGGFYCRRLARALGPDVTMYAVQPHGMNGIALPDSIEEMATDHRRSIQAIQPSGPYSVGGFCAGGVIAVEIARQLVARGEQVAPVLLIDAAAPNQDYRACWALARRVGATLRLPVRLERALFMRLKWYRDDLDALGQTSAAPWIVFLWRKLVAAARHPVMSTAEPRNAAQAGTDAEPQSLFDEYQQRMIVHMPMPFPGRVALFRSDYLDDRWRADAAAGWDKLGAHAEVHHVPGDHKTCVTTHVADLAARMRPYLPG